MTIPYSISCFLLLLLISGTLSDKLTPRQNRVLKTNCGRYVEGFTSLNQHETQDEQFKVLYGDEVKTGEAPWAVSLAIRRKGSGSGSGEPEEYMQHGTGSLISPWHVVTAAHLIGISDSPLPDCKTGDMGDAHFLNDYKDFVAFVNVTCATEANCRDAGRKDKFRPIRVKSLYIRQGYVGEGCVERESFNDLAVFELAEPVKFSKNAFPVCLPTSPESPKTGDSGYRLYGYGRDDADKNVETGILKSLDSFVADCTEYFTYGGIFCTAAPSKGLSCAGDSGSGVIRRAKDREVQEIAGVLSAGMSCSALLRMHQREDANRWKKTQETDLVVDVASHLDFFCKCCGLCR